MLFGALSSNPNPTGASFSATLAVTVPPLPSIPSPPGLTYSSSEESSEPDLSSFGDDSGRAAPNVLSTSVRKDIADSQPDSGHQLSSSHKSSPQHTHTHRHRQRVHDSQPREQQSNHTLRRSASTSTTLRGSKSSSSLKQRHREKRVYFPYGQTVSSLVPLSFSGEFDEDDQPVFVDEFEPRERFGSAPTLLAKSRPSVSSKRTAPVLHDVLNEPPESSKPNGSTLRLKRSLTIFDVFSFPLPPTPGMPRLPIPRSPGHRATASDGLIHSPLRPDARPPVPALPMPNAKAQQNIQPLRTSSQRRHAPRPLPPVPPLPIAHSSPSLCDHQRSASPRSASAGGIGELESFLNLNSPFLPAFVRRPTEESPPGGDKGCRVDEVVVAGDRSPVALRSARAKDSGIDSLIGMLDAEIVA